MKSARHAGLCQELGNDIDPLSYGAGERRALRAARNASGHWRCGALASLHLATAQAHSGADVALTTAEFAADLNALFRSNSILVPPEVMLGRDASGRVKVGGEHPDKARIEAVFEADYDLRNRYGQIAAAHMLHRAVEGYDEFVTQYQRLQGSPAAQEALVQARIARNSAPFALVVGGGEAESVFGGLSVRA